MVRVTVKVTVSPTLGRGFETVLVRPRSAPLAGSTKFGSEPNVNFTSLICVRSAVKPWSLKVAEPGFVLLATSGNAEAVKPGFVNEEALATMP